MLGSSSIYSKVPAEASYRSNR